MSVEYVPYRLWLSLNDTFLIPQGRQQNQTKVQIQFLPHWDYVPVLICWGSFSRLKGQFMRPLFSFFGPSKALYLKLAFRNTSFWAAQWQTYNVFHVDIQVATVKGAATALQEGALPPVPRAFQGNLGRLLYRSPSVEPL